MSSTFQKNTFCNYENRILCYKNIRNYENHHFFAIAKNIIFKKVDDMPFIVPGQDLDLLLSFDTKIKFNTEMDTLYSDNLEIRFTHVSKTRFCNFIN